MDNATTESNATERDELGRFLKGNRGGPGNPFTRQTAQLRRAALEAVSPEDIKDIIEALKTKAREGDVAAIKLLLSYTIGKPTEAPDPDTLDQHEWATIANNHVPDPAGLTQIIRGMPVEALLLMLQAALPALFPSKLAVAHEAVTQTMDAFAEDIGANDDDDDAAEAEQPEKATAPATSQDQRPAAAPVPDWMQALIDRLEERSGPVETPAPPIGNGVNGTGSAAKMGRETRASSRCA